MGFGAHPSRGGIGGLWSRRCSRPGRSRSERVARELSLDEEVTGRLLASAVGARLARVDRAGRVSLSRLGAPLRADLPRTVASYIADQAAPAWASAYANLDAQLREGAGPSGHRRAFGNSIWEYLTDHPSEGAVFADAIRELSAIDMTVVRAYPWPGAASYATCQGELEPCLPSSPVAYSSGASWLTLPR